MQGELLGFWRLFFKREHFRKIHGVNTIYFNFSAGRLGTEEWQSLKEKRGPVLHWDLRTVHREQEAECPRQRGWDSMRAEEQKRFALTAEGLGCIWEHDLLNNWQSNTGWTSCRTWNNTQSRLQTGKVAQAAKCRQAQITVLPKSFSHANENKEKLLWHPCTNPICLPSYRMLLETRTINPGNGRGSAKRFSSVTGNQEGLQGKICQSLTRKSASFACIKAQGRARDAWGPHAAAEHSGLWWSWELYGCLHACPVLMGIQSDNMALENSSYMKDQPLYKSPTKKEKQETNKQSKADLSGLWKLNTAAVLSATTPPHNIVREQTYTQWIDWLKALVKLLYTSLLTVIILIVLIISI